MSDEKKTGQAEVIDEMFVQSRMQLDMIIGLLCGKLEKMAADIEPTIEGLAAMEKITHHLEKLVFLRQMNLAKVRDLANFAPKQYRTVLTDENIRQRLRETRDSDNFPKRGPRGPRDNVAPPADSGEESAT